MTEKLFQIKLENKSLQGTLGVGLNKIEKFWEVYLYIRRHHRHQQGQAIVLFFSKTKNETKMKKLVQQQIQTAEKVAQLLAEYDCFHVNYSNTDVIGFEQPGNGIDNYQVRLRVYEGKKLSSRSWKKFEKKFEKLGQAHLAYSKKQEVARKNTEQTAQAAENIKRDIVSPYVLAHLVKTTPAQTTVEQVLQLAETNSISM